jgi:RNA polymerase sigma-70 factor, ECF subfamily
MGEKQPHFEKLLLPHLDGAYNLARWLIERDQDAQAIVHEAYLQALQEFTKFREGDARSQLLSIVRKRAHSWMIQTPKKHSKVIPFAEAFPGEPSAAAEAMADRSGAVRQDRNRADRSTQPASEASDQESKRPLYEALSKLPVEFREILVLHDIEGWTYSQLASGLEISRTMVSNRLSMARRSLRQELGKAHRTELNDR